MKSSEITAKQGTDDEETDESSVATQLENLIESLTKRMITSEMEDFELVSRTILPIAPDKALFHLKKYWHVSCFSVKTCCGYSLEVPQ